MVSVSYYYNIHEEHFKPIKLSDINKHGEFIVDSTGQADPEQPHVVCLILGLFWLKFRNQVIDCFTKGPVIHRS